jgi:DNA polymerase-3 subunit delta
MRLTPDKLASHLRNPLKPLYLLSGDEPLQREESLDVLRAAAREQGYEERTVIHTERGFDASVLQQFGDSLSLFATLRIIELRINSKVDDKTRKALVSYTSNLPADTLSLIIFGFRVDASMARSKWFSTIEKNAVHLQAWTINARDMPGWVRQRAHSRGLQLDDDALGLLAERGEGNLLACAQEIDTLQLLHPQTLLTTDHILAATRDSARYDAFSLVDTCFAGDAARAVRILRVLREDGVSLPEITGALAWALRSAAEIAPAVSRGVSLEQAMGPSHSAWRSQQRLPLMRSAIARHPAGRWGRFLQRIGSLERRAKGHIGRMNIGIRRPAAEAWIELESLILALCGLRPRAK